MSETILHSGGFVDRFGNLITVEFYKRTSNPQMSVSPSTLSFGSSASTKTLTVDYSGSLGLSVSGGSGWLTYSSATGGTSTHRVYNVTATSNANPTVRNAVIYLQDSYDNKQVPVTQAAGSTPTPTPTISVTPSSFTFNVEGGTGTLYVSSEDTVTFTLVPEWVTITAGTPSGGIQPFTITVGQNVGYARNQTIFVEDSTGTATFTVSQAAAISTLAAFPSEFSMFSAGYSGSNTIQVTYNGSLSAVAYTYGAWASISLVSSSTSFNTYNISVYENFESTSRDGYLWFSDAMDHLTISIFQAGAYIPTTVTVDPKSFIFGSGQGGGVATVTFTGNEPSCTITQTGSWLTAVPISAASNGVVRYSITAEASSLMLRSRQGTVTWDDGNGGSDYLTVTQISRSTAIISPSSLEFPYSGGTSLVTVSYIGFFYDQVTISVNGSASEWISAVVYEPSSLPSNTKIFSVTAFSTNLGSDRTSEVVVWTSAAHTSIPVTQYSMQPATYLYADPSSFHFGSASSHSTMTVYFSGTLTSSAQDDYSGVWKWFVCDRIAANTGSNTYVINVRSNTTGASRTGYLFFHDDGNDEDIMVPVKQESTNLYAIPSYLSFTDARGSSNITIYHYGSNISESITGYIDGGMTWVTYSIIEYYTGRRIYNISVGGNAGSPRTAYLNIHDNDTGEDLSFPINQEGY